MGIRQAGERIKIWLETEQFLKQNEICRDCIEDSIKNTVFYPEDEAICLELSRKSGSKVPKNVSVENIDTFSAALNFSESRKGSRIAALNFANAYHPGGGVKGGAAAQEEDLCRVSTLYPVLDTKENRRRFYDAHSKRAGAYGTSDILYTPNIFVFRFCDYSFMLPDDFFFVDVITCAAPQFRKPLANGENPEASSRLYDLHLIRGKRIIESAVRNEAEVLILGAFGCGAFNNDPEIVAKAYRALMISYAHYFDEVKFAVYSTDPAEKNYRVFKEVLG